jgi:hypothetical protein
MTEKLSLASWSTQFHEFPFQAIYLGTKRTKVFVLAAPLYANQFHTFYKLKQKGYVMIGLSSYGFYPFVNESDCLHNDRAPMLKSDEFQSILKQADGWLTCSMEPIPYDIPQLRFSESDCHLNPHTSKPKGLVKKYDVLYNSGSDCDFHQYHKNWNLAKDCFQKMSDAGLTVLVISRNAPVGFDLPNVTFKPYLNWYEFLDTIEESRVLFVPNVSDASPRILTESLCKGTPILVNKHIFGGWKYVNEHTGAFFESQDDVMIQLHAVLNASCDPRKWFMDTHYPDGESVQLNELKEFIASICGGTIPLEEEEEEEEEEEAVGEQLIIEYNYTLDIPIIGMHDIQFLYVSVDTVNDTSLCRNDLITHVGKLNMRFNTHLTPHHWVFWPYYKLTGWGDKQDFPL